MSEEIPFEVKQNWRTLAKIWQQNKEDEMKSPAKNGPVTTKKLDEDKDPRVLLTMDQAHKLTGISKSTITGWLHNGTLKGFKGRDPKKQWSIEKSDLLARAANRRSQKSGPRVNSKKPGRQLCELCNKNRLVKFFSTELPEVCIFCEDELNNKKPSVPEYAKYNHDKWMAKKAAVEALPGPPDLEITTPDIPMTAPANDPELVAEFGYQKSPPDNADLLMEIGHLRNQVELLQLNQNFTDAKPAPQSKIKRLLLKIVEFVIDELD